MKILSFDLTRHNPALVKTEILYSIANARAAGADFVGLNITGNDSEKIKLSATKILRAAKRQETIQLFASSLDLSSMTTEAQYLNNKYPELVNFCNDICETIFIKI